MEVSIIIVIIIWAASGRLWLLQTLRLCCAAAGRRKRSHGMCFLLRQRLRQGRGGGLLQKFWRPCTDAARCGVANAMAANGRLGLLQTLRVRCVCRPRCLCGALPARCRGGGLLQRLSRP